MLGTGRRILVSPEHRRAEVRRRPGAGRGRTADGGVALVEGRRRRVPVYLVLVPEGVRGQGGVVAVRLVADVRAAGRRRVRLVHVAVIAVGPVARRVAAGVASRVCGCRWTWRWV